MQGDINLGSGRFAVATVQRKERLKRCGRVRIQERLPQANLAYLAYRQILPLVPGITEAGFPVPSLKIVTKLSHLTLKADVEKGIPIGELLTPITGVVNAPKPNTSSHRHWSSINNQSRICNCERIKRIRDWDTDAGGTKAYVKAWGLKWI